MKSEHQAYGQAAENAACEFLAQKMQLLTRNYRCPMGELDLVFWEAPDTLVAVEVKARRSMAFGGAVYAYNSKKNAKVTKSIYHYAKHHNLEHASIRIDLVTLQGENWKIEWYKDVCGQQYF